MYLYFLCNIIKAVDEAKPEIVKIEAKKIIIYDLLTKEVFKTEHTTEIELGKKGVNYDNILIKIDLFNNTKDGKNLSNEQKEYKPMLIINNNREITDKEIVDPSKSLWIYICPKCTILGGMIKIKIDNVEYKNKQIKHFINKINRNKFLKCKDEKDIISLLCLYNLEYDNNNSIKNILSNEDTIKQYYINNLQFFSDTDKNKYTGLNEDLIREFKENILSGKSIEIELKKYKNKINLTYDEDNLTENIKNLLEGIKNGKTDVESNCKSIIEALKNIQDEGEYKIIKGGVDVSNNDTEINDNTQYELTLPDKCYEFKITVEFSIKNNLKNDFKFKYTNKLNKDNKVEILINKNDDIKSIKKKLNEYFQKEDVFYKTEIIYKDHTNTIIDEGKKYINSETIKVEIPNDIIELVVDKNVISVNLKFENNVKDKEFTSTFPINYPNFILKDNKYNTLVTEIKNILKITDELMFEIYNNDIKLENNSELKDNSNIIVKIIKEISNILKDKTVDEEVDNNNNNNNNNNANNNIGGTNNDTNNNAGDTNNNTDKKCCKYKKK